MYDQAVGLIERSGLDDLFRAQKGYRRVDSRWDRGRIRVLAADENTADGVIPTLALVDELHRHKTDGLYGVFRDGLGPRDGQIVTISRHNANGTLDTTFATDGTRNVVDAAGGSIFAGGMVTGEAAVLPS